MILRWSEKSFHDAGVAGEDDKSVRIFVQPADGEDVFDPHHILYFFLATLCGMRNDAPRFVKCDIDVGLLFAMKPHFDVVGFFHLFAKYCESAVDEDPTFLDEFVSSTPRGLLMQGEIFVYAHREDWFFHDEVINDEARTAVRAVPPFVEERATTQRAG